MEQDRGGEAWSVRWSAAAGGSDQLSRLRSRGVRPSEQQIPGPGHQVRGREYEHYGSGSGNSNYSVLLVIFDTRLCDIFNLLCVVKINFSTLKTTSNRFQIKPFIKMCWHQNYTPTNLCIHNLHLLFVYFWFKTHSSLCHYYTWWPNKNTFQFDHFPCLYLIQIWICTICNCINLPPWIQRIVWCLRKSLHSTQRGALGKCGSFPESSHKSYFEFRGL